MAEQTGIAAVLENVPADLLRPALVEAEQLALLPDDLTGRERVDLARRGPGRPQGARNKRTADFADFILCQYRSPLVVMAETYSRSVGELSAELGCTKQEAFSMQLQAARELAPYLHQKQPVAVNVDSSGVIQLVIESAIPAGSVPGETVDGVITIEAQSEPFTAEGESEENQ